MDELDRKILRELQRNNRISSDELGDKIGLSATACQRRLKRLRESKVICKEVAILNGVEFDSYVTVIVEVSVKQGGAEIIENFKTRMLDCEQVQQCFYVAGQSDFILIITAKNMLDYEKLTKKLFFVDDNIQKFTSTVAMENVKVGLDIPI
jgi:Lrp/AsnC family transcriptional regulator, leucine-responsive regulatory protein